MFKKVLSILLIIFMIQIPQISLAADPSIKAEGADGAINISWEPHPNASYYDVVMIRPKMESVTGIFSGTEWVVGDAEPDTKYSFFVTAYDSNLNQIYRYDEVSAEVDSAKPTLAAPCKKILAFTINQKQYTIDGVKSKNVNCPYHKRRKKFPRHRSLCGTNHGQNRLGRFDKKNYYFPALGRWK
ncbi:MAG: fibronectin type III domain-containing protein [Caldisericia bacterium]